MSVTFTTSDILVMKIFIVLVQVYFRSHQCSSSSVLVMKKFSVLVLVLVN